MRGFFGLLPKGGPFTFVDGKADSELKSRFNPLTSGDPDKLASIIVSLLPSSIESIELTISGKNPDASELAAWSCGTEEHWKTFFEDFLGSNNESLPSSIKTLEEGERGLTLELKIEGHKIENLVKCLHRTFSSLNFSISR